MVREAAPTPGAIGGEMQGSLWRPVVTEPRNWPDAKFVG